MATELESLVVRMLGDATSYLNMLSEAERSTRRTMEAIDRQGKGIVNSFRSLSAAMSGILGSLDATGFVQRNLGFYTELENQQLRLAAAIQVNGRDVKSTIKAYDEFADAMMRVTTATKFQIIPMLLRAEALGLNEQQSKRAVKNAIALSAATGGEAKAFLRATAALEHGSTSMLSRSYLPTLRVIKGQSEKVRVAQERLAKDFSLATAQAEGFGGQLKRLSNEMWFLSRQFFVFVGEAAKPFVETLREIIQHLSQLDETTKKYIATAMMLVLAFGTVFSSLLSVRAGLGLVLLGLRALTGVVMALARPIQQVVALLMGGLVGALRLVVALFLVQLTVIGYIGSAVMVVVSSFQLIVPLIKAIGPAILTILMFVFKLLNPVRLIQAAWMAVTNLLSLLGAILTSSIVTWGLALIPILAIVAALAVLVGLAVMWVNKVGGIGNAWKIVKKLALDAWAWLKPVRQAAQSLFNTLVEFATIAWNTVKEVALDALGAIFGSGFDWEDLRDKMRDAILMVEFGLRNLSDVWDVVETYLRFSLLRLGNQFVWLFTELVPAAWDWFLDNWQDVLRLLFNLWVGVHMALAQVVGTLVKAIVNNAVQVFQKIPQLIAKKVTLAEVFKDFGKDMGPAKKAINEVINQFNKDRKRLDPFEVPDRKEGDLEAEIRREWETKARRLGESWEEFRRRKLEEFAKEGEGTIKDKAKKTGFETGSEFASGLGKGMEKVQAVLTLSAAWFTELAEFRNKIVEAGTPTGGSNPPLAPAGAKPPDKEPKLAMAEQTDILKDILGELKEANRQEGPPKPPGLEILPANLV